MLPLTTSFIFFKVSEEPSIAAELSSKLHLTSNIVLLLKDDGVRARIGRHGENVERLAP